MDAYHVIMLIGALAGGGFLSTVWHSTVGKFFGQKQRRLDEAEVLSNISTAIREEIREENKDLRDRMDRIVEAVCGLTDVLDELFPKMSSLTAEERIRLRERIARAKRAT